MKTRIVILFALLTSWAGAQVYDDVYFKPSDNFKVEKEVKEEVKPKYKNGAKQIIYIQKKDVSEMDSTYIDLLSSDSLLLNESLLVSDSLQLENTETGYYINGFTGSQNDFEYAERIRKFHDPRYTIFISDPRYNDIYFLNSWDWNVYVDGAYAYVTPTWTNPMWNDYYWRPFSYNSWNWYSPYSWYSNYYDPFYWNMYGGFYGSYYSNYYGSWGYPYSSYYNNWGYNPYWGYAGSYSYNYKDDRHNDAVRRTRSGGISTSSDLTNVATRVSGSYNKTASTASSVNSNTEVSRLRTSYSGVSRVGGETRTTNATRSTGTNRTSINLNTRTTRSGSSSNVSRQSTAVRSSAVRTNSNPERTYRSSSESTHIVRTPSQNSSSSNTRSYSPSSTNVNSSSSYRSSSSSSYSSGSSNSSSSSRSSSSSSGTRSSSSSSSRR